jgi:hypothetical protein
MADYVIGIGVVSLLQTHRVAKAAIAMFSGVVPARRKLLDHMLVENVLETAFDTLCLAVNS